MRLMFVTHSAACAARRRLLRAAGKRATARVFAAPPLLHRWQWTDIEPGTRPSRAAHYSGWEASQAAIAIALEAHQPIDGLLGGSGRFQGEVGVIACGWHSSCSWLGGPRCQDSRRASVQHPARCGNVDPATCNSRSTFNCSLTRVGPGLLRRVLPGRHRRGALPLAPARPCRRRAAPGGPHRRLHAAGCSILCGHRGGTPSPANAHCLGRQRYAGAGGAHAAAAGGFRGGGGAVVDSPGRPHGGCHWQGEGCMPACVGGCTGLQRALLESRSAPGHCCPLPAARLQVPTCSGEFKQQLVDFLDGFRQAPAAT